MRHPVQTAASVIALVVLIVWLLRAALIAAAWCLVALAALAVLLGRALLVLAPRVARVSASASRRSIAVDGLAACAFSA